MIDLFLVCIFCIFGVITGIATGLLPGLHVNNISLILLSLSGVIVGSLTFLYQQGLTESFILLLIAIFITSVSISHTFHDYIPSSFLGAPDADTALSVLPAHTLLLKGKAYEGVFFSATGSLGAIFFCFLLLLPVRFVIGEPIYLYETIKDNMLWVLICITIIMILTEKGKITDFNLKGKKPYFLGMAFAAFLFFLSGIFGVVVFELTVDSPIGLQSPVLFPALTGLFGISTLIHSLKNNPDIPTQSISEPNFDKKTKKSSIISVITGSLGGILVSIIPGITSATGTVIAMNARGKTGGENTDDSNKKQTITTLSAVNTACAFFVVVMLFVILRPRSGAAIAAAELVSIEEWSSLLLPSNLSFLMIAVLLAGVLSYFSTLKTGIFFAKHFSKIPYQPLVILTILFVTTLVFLFTGIVGLLVLLVATIIGLIPVLWGVRRSHCMGILLFPIILYFL
ncbi:MAG: tripartite tricarboxylate transporter permease [Candidatus Thermoplasmatota archaeon]